MLNNNRNIHGLTGAMRKLGLHLNLQVESLLSVIIYHPHFCLSTSSPLHQPVKTIRAWEPLSKGIAFPHANPPSPFHFLSAVSSQRMMCYSECSPRDEWMDGWQNGRMEERPQNEDELCPTRLITDWPCHVVYAPARVKPPGHPSGWMDRE